MRLTLFTLMCIASAVATAATVYKWVDENGVIHYSDQPHENAEKVQLKALQTYSAPKNLPASGPSAPATESLPAYQSCLVAEPTNDQMYMNTSTVTAGVVVQPAVRPGDRVVVTLDGQRVPGVPATGGQFTISPVDRGTHTLQLVVEDPTGRAICQSPSVTFHVHQASIQNPVNPAIPKH